MIVWEGGAPTPVFSNSQHSGSVHDPVTDTLDCNYDSSTLAERESTVRYGRAHA